MSTKPPIAATRPQTLTAHNHTRIDPYYWLRERENPEVIAYLNAENDYHKAVLQDTESLQETLFQELKGRIQETDLSVPVKMGDYYYYTRTEEGKQYDIHCRKPGNLDAPEQIILDVNQLAGQSPYCALAVFEPSPDHKLLAYSVDLAGNEMYTLYVKDLTTGELLPDAIPNTYYSMAWANDNQTLFYNVLDEALRPHQLRRHLLGTAAQDDTLVYQEDDARFFLGITKSKDDQYLLLVLNSKESDEVRFLAADNPTGDFQPLHPREAKLEYGAEHHRGRFYIFTNADGAKNFKIVTAPVDNPGRANWTDLMPYDEAVKIDGLEMFRDHIAIYQRQDGLRQIRLGNLNQPDYHLIAFPEPVYSAWGGHNPEFNSQTLRFHYTSLVTPEAVYDYDMETRERVLKKQHPVLGGYDPAQYVSERVWATAEDGTRVPLSVVYKKGARDRGRAPLLLYGYGSYGHAIDPYFSSNRLSLMDRGIIYAIAHIRGGGEMGRPWYENGKYLAKRNSFTDFIACAEHLIAAGYTSADQLVALGGSAGGLLMGAVATLRPDLFKGIIADVPFVDVITTMSDPTIPLTVTEYEEWGNPENEAYYHYMLSYSPYDNVTAQTYPNLMVTAGLNDPRVQYWEPAKWVARLRATKTDDNLLLLRTNMGAGHGGASGRYDFLREVANDYAFFLKVLELTERSE
ncbi:MAG: S9 family peptidase [Chloroflexi bacterium]|nr:S9 family peptidase [Chloroflexota bacterium]MBP8055870.1 S9 family peptidase [Chloroflexota bacterium]